MFTLYEHVQWTGSQSRHAECRIMSYDDVASAVLFYRRQIGLESRQHERKWLCLCGWSILTRHHYGREEVHSQTKAKTKKKAHTERWRKITVYGWNTSRL